MKAILHRLILIGLLLVVIVGKAYSVTTYDWVGTTATAGVYNWNNKLNWQVAGVAAATIPGATDIVQIAVNSFTNNPTVTDAESCASIVFGTYDNFTLTVTGTLTVSGNITQKNDPNFYQYTILAGTGTITCGSFTLGDNTQPNSGVGAVNNVSSQVALLTVNGNITLNAVGNSTNDGIEYPYFSLDANKITLNGQIVTTTFSSPLSGGVGDPNYPGLGLFQMDNNASASTLELTNASPILTPITTGFTIDFTNNGTGAGTVIYDATAGTQTVYTTGTTGIGINNYNYDYLTFSGASKKTVIGGALTIGNDWTTGGTGVVDLSTNNPVVTVTGNLVNSANITQGSGNITVTSTLQNNSSTITLGSGALTVSNIMQINAGTVSTSSGTVTIGGIFQNNAGTLACGSGNVIFKGSYTNSSTFTAGTGAVYFSGTSQTLVDNGATGTTFNNVTFNCSGTATMGAGVGNFGVSATGVLTMVSPAKLVAGTAATGYLTLKSTAASSATIAAISGTSTITGFVNVQRYVTGGSSTYRGYRLLSSPVYASTVSSNNVFSVNYLKNSMYVTGSTGAGGGWDKTGNPTIYLYRENMAPGNGNFIVGNFRGLNNISASPGYLLDSEVGTFNIPAGNGFLFFFRGNRSTSLVSKTVSPFTAPENTTLTTSGILNQGQITVHDWYTPASANLGYTVMAGNAAVRGFNLVGNPYASSINWDLLNAVTTTSGIYEQGVSNTVYVFDPVSKNYGAYIKGSGGVGTHNTSNILPSGQGFFVQATAASPSLVFNESAKINTQVSGGGLLLALHTDFGVDMAVNNAVNHYLRLQLTKDSVNTDDILIRFNNDAVTTYDQNVDAEYKPGYGMVNLYSLSSDKVPLAISLQPFPKTRESIALSVKASASGTYQLQLKKLVAIPKIYRLTLVDQYAKDSVDMRESSDYRFSIDQSDTTTFGPNRFKLSISVDPAYAYSLLNFTAVSSESAKQVQLSWKTKNEDNFTYFTVERSTDNGNNFEVIGGMQSDGSGAYGMPDTHPREGTNLYRLKQVDINNNVTYSNVIMLDYSGLSNTVINSNNINVYPNPAINSINLSITEPAGSHANNYNIRISNSSGLIVKNITSAQPSWQGNVSDLLTGTYVIQVINTQDQSLVGKAKFVKL
ncbi:MAG: T9SS type A sorting domain-containing protein [Sphingobacteriales bacterium]